VWDLVRRRDSGRLGIAKTKSRTGSRGRAFAAYANSPIKAALRCNGRMRCNG
jgi:hypothetical protein